MALRVLFFGTPAFATPTLTRLFESAHQVVGVVTQPDRRRGRGQHVTPGAIKALASGRALPILQPERLGDESFLGLVRELAPDVGVVAAYGRLLPQVLLDLPARGMLNVHASLLPRWRGAAPVHRAILAGDPVTGVTIMRVVLALDAGPMVDRVATAIDPQETSEALEMRLAHLGADLLAATLDRLASGALAAEPQDERLVTYARRLERADGHVDWARPALAVHNQIRGLHPWPLAAARLQGRRVMFHRSEVGASDAHAAGAAAPPGTIVRAGPDALDVATQPGVVRIREVQLEGKRPVNVAALLNGWTILTGERFEE
jgi:methionyl-tRNA formyltransferase